jgi:hypothetical protein
MRKLASFVLALSIALALAAPASAAVAKSGARQAAGAKAAKPSEWKPVVPFIEDDFGRALALAKERKRPVFIEGWAPW